MDGELHAGFLGQHKAVGQAGVIRAEAQQARHQRTVGAVAPARGGKAAVESNVRLGGDVAQQLLSGWRRGRSSPARERRTDA